MARHEPECLNEYFSKDSIFRVSDESGESSDESDFSFDNPPPREQPPRSAKRNYGHDIPNTWRSRIKQKNVSRGSQNSRTIGDENIASVYVPPKVPQRNANRFHAHNPPSTRKGDASCLNTYFEKDNIFHVSDEEEISMDENNPSDISNPPPIPPRNARNVTKIKEDATDLNCYFESNSIFRVSEDSEVCSNGNNQSVTLLPKIPPRKAMNTTEEKSHFRKLRSNNTGAQHDHKPMTDNASMVPVRKNSVEFQNDAFNLLGKNENLIDEQSSLAEDPTLSLVPDIKTFSLSTVERKEDFTVYSEKKCEKCGEKTNLLVNNSPELQSRNSKSFDVNVGADISMMFRARSEKELRQKSSMDSSKIMPSRQDDKCNPNILRIMDSDEVLNGRRASLQDDQFAKGAVSRLKENTLGMNKYFSENSIFRLSVESEDSIDNTSCSSDSRPIDTPKNKVSPALNPRKSDIPSIPRVNIESDLPASTPDTSATRNKFTQFLLSGFEGLKNRRRHSNDFSSPKDTSPLIPREIGSRHEKSDTRDTLPSNSKQRGHLCYDNSSRNNHDQSDKMQVSNQYRISYFSAFEVDGRKIEGIHTTRDCAFCLFYRGGSQIDFVTHHGDVKSMKFNNAIDDLTVDQHGNIYFACAKENYVQRIGQNRGVIQPDNTYIPMPGYPRVITYNPSYDELIVCLNDSSTGLKYTIRSNRILRWKVQRNTSRQGSFGPEKRDFKQVGNTKCSDLKFLRCPASVSATSIGDLLFSDSSTRSLVVFDGKINFKYMIKGEEVFDRTSLFHHPIVCCERMSNRIFLLCNRSEHTSSGKPNIVVLDSSGNILEKICVEDIKGYDINAADFDSYGNLLIASDNIVMKFEVRY